MVRFTTILLLFGLVIFLGFMSGALKVNHDRFKCLRASNHATEWDKVYTIAGIDIRWPSFNRTCEVEVDPVTGQILQQNQ